MSISKENAELTLQMYTNPLLVQQKQLELFEQYVFDGRELVDGNNVFTFGLELDATMAAGIVNEISNSLNVLYPARAQTMSDLYRHMSDYDYIDMFSTPATTSIELLLDRDFLINNAPKLEGSNVYHKVVLPAFSTFTLGEYTFGIHYPIEIRIRKAYTINGQIDYEKCLFQVTWDTAIPNPLYKLTSNVLDHRMLRAEGMNLLAIEIPIHQFITTISTHDVVPSTGFFKRFNYTNRFYALRVFHYSDNKWVELSSSLSEVVYDPSTPTAVVKVLSDISTIEVSIPQVYFTNGQIGNRIMCMLYTTHGNIDVDLTIYNSDKFGASFLFNDQIVDTTYSAFLKRMPKLQIIPLTTRINNGTGGKSFTEMKRRIVHTVGGDDLLITPSQLEAHMNDTGFKVSRYIDNITNRIYMARKELTYDTGYIIPACTNAITLTENILETAGSEYDTIIPTSDDGSGYMVLPNTVFKYSPNEDTMYPLSIADKKRLTLLSTNDYIKELNTNIYTCTPFHIKVSTDPQLPMAGAYDLFDPKITDITFVDENEVTNTQVSMADSVIAHLNDGVGGYRLAVVLYKTTDLKNTMVYDASPVVWHNIMVMLRTTTHDVPVYMLGKYMGADEAGNDVVVFDMSTNYRLNTNDELCFTTFKKISGYDEEYTDRYIPLQHSYELLFFVNQRFIQDEAVITRSSTIANVPKEVKDKDMVWLATQSLTITLGEPISSLMCNTYTNFSPLEYATYNSTQYAAYSSDIYKTDDQGVYEYTIEDGKVKLQVNHYAGDVIISSSMVDEHGLRPPAYVYEWLGDDNIMQQSYMYLNDNTSSPTPELYNIWEPMYIVPTTEDGSTKYKCIVTGDTYTTVEDVLSYTTEVIHNDSALQYPDTSVLYKSVEMVDGKLQVVDKIDGRYVYIKDVTLREDRSITPRYIAYFEDDMTDIGNGTFMLTKFQDSTMTYMEVIDDANTFIYDPATDTWSIDRTQQVTTSSYGAMFYRDPTKENFNWESYMTISELQQFYKDYDERILNPKGGVTLQLVNKYGLSMSIGEALINYRYPWTKMVAAGHFEVIRGYANNKTYLSLTTDIVINGAKGLSAIEKIQSSARHRSSIARYTTQEEAIAVADTTPTYTLIWTEGYDPATDITSLTEVPLIGDLDVNDTLKRGALLYTSGSGNGYHYVVCTGPSFSTCYNYLMGFNTYSGFMYRTRKVKPLPVITDTLTEISYLADKGVVLTDTDKDRLRVRAQSILSASPVIEEYTNIIDDELLFTLTSWSKHKYWPWESTNWLCSDGTPLFASASTVLRIAQEASDAKVLHMEGDVVLSENGEPIVSEECERKLLYRIDSIHTDYKYVASTDTKHAGYKSSIRALLRGYFQVLDTTKKQLLEHTELYFEPIKSMGAGLFKNIDGSTISRPLAIELTLRLHVASTVYNNKDTRQVIEDNVLTLVEQHIADGTINCAEMANEITASLSDTVYYVDVLGIDGDPTVQTMLADDSNECAPQLKTRLVMDADGIIRVVKGLNIQWAVIG